MRFREKKKLKLPRFLRSRYSLHFVLLGFLVVSFLVLRSVFSWIPADIETPGRVEHIAFSPDGKVLAVDSYTPNGKSLRIYSTPQGLFGWKSNEETLDYLNPPELLWSPCPDLVIATYQSIIEKTGGNEATLFELSYPHELAASPDGNWIAAIGQTPKGPEVVLWDAALGRLQWRQVMDFGAGHAAFSSRYLCIGGRPLQDQIGHLAKVSVFDAASGRHLHRFEAPLPFINDMALCPTQPNLLAMTDNSGVSVLDVESGKRVSYFPFKSEHGALGELAFSPDGSILAAAESTSSGVAPSDVLLFELRISESRDPELRHFRTLAGHTSWVKDLAFSPDGNTLATGGYDSKVLLWRIR